MHASVFLSPFINAANVPPTGIEPVSARRRHVSRQRGSSAIELWGHEDVRPLTAHPHRATASAPQRALRVLHQSGRAANPHLEIESFALVLSDRLESNFGRLLAPALVAVARDRNDNPLRNASVTTDEKRSNFHCPSARQYNSFAISAIFALYSARVHDKVTVRE